MIIKEIDSKDEALKQLLAIQNMSLSEKQRALVSKEVAILRRGHSGEKSAAYYINSAFPKWFIAHDVRIDMGGVVAQIDHIAINRAGVILLFESKHFSSDIKVDSDGNFQYYSFKRKSYRPFPSPLEQSKRHATVIKEAFKKVGYKVPALENFAVFSHESKIYKPKRRFDNVCYVDQVKNSHKKMVDNLSVIKVFSGSATMIRNKLFKGNSAKDALEAVIDRFHKPLVPDYHAKFGVAPGIDNHNLTGNIDKRAGGNDILPTPLCIDELKEEPPAMKTLSKAATYLGSNAKKLESELIRTGFLSTHDKGYLIVTKHGREKGIKHLRSQGGYFILFPVTFLNEFASVFRR